MSLIAVKLKVGPALRASNQHVSAVGHEPALSIAIYYSMQGCKWVLGGSDTGYNAEALESALQVLVVVVSTLLLLLLRL